MLSPESHDPKISASVMDTIAYSERLIRKFGGWEALPLICPMVPFLDPGWRFFEEPDQHGYRIFHRTLAIRLLPGHPRHHRRNTAAGKGAGARRTLPAALRDEIRSYKRKILAYSSDQIIPVRRPFGGRWFDDVTVPQQMIEDISAIPAGR